MKLEYDAVVIGTGFGGAVSACRLAQAGLSGAVLERGRRYDDAAKQRFPRNFKNLSDGWFYRDKQGLYDVKEISEMTVVEAAGYGGGSLIYANVHLRPPEDAFASGWPGGYGRELLDPYYDLVAYMLDIKPITAEDPRKIPPKTWLMKDVAGQLGRSAQFCYPNLAVNFGDSDVARDNKFGVPQKGCNHCGECDVGCSNRAKNTLDMNYLPLAERAGAEVSCQTEVCKIEPVGSKYRVHFVDHATGQQSSVLTGAVFVCCGAVNTTELLLRCRDQHGTLPALSPALGRRYSGNGDYLAFSFDTSAERPFHPSKGPTITTAIVYDGAEAGGERSWFIFQEGGYPQEIGKLLQILNPHRFQLPSVQVGMLKNKLASELFELAAQQADDVPASCSDRSAVFLAMGRDRANGRIDLMPLTHLLRITWDTAGNMGLYSAEERFSQDVANALGGVMGYNPLWKLIRQPVAVHNLGGCVMADDPAQGVVDAHGEVYNYPNLFVMDGAALPSATGVNPSHTIAAVAERNIEHYLRRRLEQPTWQAPQRALARPIVDPLTHISIPHGGTRPPETQALGLTFTETMKGYYARGVQPPEDYEAAARKGEAEGSRIEFNLTITFPDVEAFIADRSHAATVTGKVFVPGITGPDGAHVRQGVFNLFVASDSFYERKMLYALPFYGADGERYLLDGFKDVRDDGNLDVWRATSTLYTLIRAGHERTDPVVASGIMHILKLDFAKQMTTFRTIGPGSAARRAEAIASFGKLFLGTLVDVFVRPRLE